MYKLKSTQCKSALHKLKRQMPYEYDLNIYKGCSHGCIYCYARYTQKYMNDSGNVIYAKVNITDHLERELKAFNGVEHVINMGGVTDAYQESEKTAKLMRGVLKLMIKYKNPIVICSKSDLVLRDMDLIEELASLTRVNIATSVSCVDDKLARLIEPGAKSPQERLNMIHEFSNKTQAMTGVHLFPILPKLTDGYDQLKETFEAIHNCGPDYMLLGTLYLNGETKPYYLNALKSIDPRLYSETVKLYRNGKLDSEYKNGIYETIGRFRADYPFRMTAEEAIKWLRTGEKK